MEKSDKNKLSKEDEKLFKMAFESYKNAYAPYTKFRVGAALIDESGNTYSGCNVESVDLTLTTHAEMNAIDTMVSNGGRIIKKILVVLKTNTPPGTPCGLCRQKMLEFMQNNVEIISVNLNNKEEIDSVFRTNLLGLMPYAFTKDQVDK